MKKILWVLLLLVLVLTACAQEEAIPETTAPLIEVEIPYEQTEPVLPYEGVELTFRSVWQQDDPQTQVLTQAAAFFEKKTGAVVRFVWPAEGEAFADIMQIPAADFEAAPPETALDLTEMAKSAGYEEKSHKYLREQIIARCGFLGAIPQTPYLGGIYYNTDAFAASGIEATPRTWEDFTRLCQTLREHDWQPMTMDREDAVTAMELHLRRAIGRDQMFVFMGKTAHWHFDQTVIGAMEQVMQFVQAGNMADGTPTDYPAGQNKMALSNSAMMVGTNADCAAVEEATLMELNWGVFPYPGEKDSGTWAAADVLVIHQDCANEQAAFDFVMLLATGEFDQLRADIARGIPADPSNRSPIVGAVEAFSAAAPQHVGIFGTRQTDTAVKLWSAWYRSASSYAVSLERSK